MGSVPRQLCVHLSAFPLLSVSIQGQNALVLAGSLPGTQGRLRLEEPGDGSGCASGLLGVLPSAGLLFTPLGPQFVYPVQWAEGDVAKRYSFSTLVSNHLRWQMFFENSQRFLPGVLETQDGPRVCSL